ncbi:MAG: hypothetical protein EHM36_06670 [Deltaproteobacteria bacterium]|nr:MAG: hypothetical protein EHM36_06670 [Deltaproteobacteria bacterium]
MLQRIPGIVEEEFRQGSIGAPRVIFTIGVSHLNRIIQSLNEGKIRIYAPLTASNKRGDYIADLNLSKENFGVSVIIPKTLANDQKVLVMTGLDKIVTRTQNQSSFASSAASP